MSNAYDNGKLGGSPRWIEGRGAAELTPADFTERDRARFAKAIEIVQFEDLPDGVIGPCRLWTGAVNRDGYGRFYIWRSGKTVARYAHRVAIAIAGVVVPAQLEVDHRCHRRRCTNYVGGHLQMLTGAENLGLRRPQGAHELTEENGVDPYVPLPNTEPVPEVPF